MSVTAKTRRWFWTSNLLRDLGFDADYPVNPVLAQQAIESTGLAFLVLGVGWELRQGADLDHVRRSLRLVLQANGFTLSDDIRPLDGDS